MTDERDSVLTKEWIDQHNAQVEAFRAEHYTRIEALTDEECQRVYDRWTTPHEHMAANKIALEFREELGMTWHEDHAIGIGMKLIHTVLVRLDKYDPDFRPRPEPQYISAVEEGELWFLPASGLLRVQLGDLSAEFRPTYAPKFGVDATDMETVYEALDRLRGMRSQDACLAHIDPPSL